MLKIITQRPKNFKRKMQCAEVTRKAIDLIGR